MDMAVTLIDTLSWPKCLLKMAMNFVELISWALEKVMGKEAKLKILKLLKMIFRNLMSSTPKSMIHQMNLQSF